MKEAKLHVSCCDFRFVIFLLSVDLDSFYPHYVSFITTFLTNREIQVSQNVPLPFSKIMSPGILAQINILFCNKHQFGVLITKLEAALT